MTIPVDLPFQVLAREWMDSIVVIPFLVAVVIFGLSLWIGLMQQQANRAWYADPWIKTAAAFFTLMLGSMLHNDWVWVLLWGVHYDPELFKWMEDYWWTAAFGQVMVFGSTVCLVRIWTPKDWTTAAWYRFWPLRPWILTIFAAAGFTLLTHWRDL